MGLTTFQVDVSHGTFYTDFQGKSSPKQSFESRCSNISTTIAVLPQKSQQKEKGAQMEGLLSLLKAQNYQGNLWPALHVDMNYGATTRQFLPKTVPRTSFVTPQDKTNRQTNKKSEVIKNPIFCTALQYIIRL